MHGCLCMQREVGDRFIRHVQLLALVTPLGWAHRWEECLPKQAADTQVLATVAQLGGDVRSDALELAQRGLLDVDVVGGDSGGFLGHESGQHAEEVDVCIPQNSLPQVGVLGLGAIIIRDLAKGGGGGYP